MRATGTMENDNPRFLGPNAAFYEEAFYETKLASLGRSGIVQLLARFADIVPFLETARFLVAIEELALDQLEQVKGIGPKTAKLLLKKFGSIEAIGNASIENLTVVPRVTKPIALSLKRRFSSH